MEFYFIEITEKEKKSPNQVCIYKKDVAVIRLLKTSGYIKDDDILNSSSIESAHGS